MAMQHSQTYCFEYLFHTNEDKLFLYMISSKIAKPDSRLAPDKEGPQNLA